MKCHSLRMRSCSTTFVDDGLLLMLSKVVADEDDHRPLLKFVFRYFDDDDDNAHEEVTGNIGVHIDQEGRKRLVFTHGDPLLFMLQNANEHVISTVV